MRWGADVAGGIPYVFENPENPSIYTGFEMDIANAIVRLMGVKQKLVIQAWDSLTQELQKSRFDIAMNGIENTSDREGFVFDFSFLLVCKGIFGPSFGIQPVRNNEMLWAWLKNDRFLLNDTMLSTNKALIRSFAVT